MPRENKKMQCEKCGQEMFESGPYLHRKEEGEPAYDGPDEVHYWCMNEKCKNFHKDIKVLKKR